MLKLFLMALIAFSITGCGVKLSALPEIKTPTEIQSKPVFIDGGCACGVSKDNLYHLVSELRETEEYCIDQLTEYEYFKENGKLRSK